MDVQAAGLTAWERMPRPTPTPELSRMSPAARQSRLVLLPIRRQLKSDSCPLSMPIEPDNPTQSDAETMLMGVQPLDAVLEARGINNHAVVAAAGGDGLAH